MSTNVRRLTGGLALASVLAVLGCSDSGSPTAPSPSGPTPLNITYTLAPGESTVLPGTGNVLMFQRVTEDSRCPAAAMCIHSGQAVVALGLLIGGDATQPFSLATTPAGRSTRLGEIEFTLERVTPYPITFPIDFPQSAYRIEIRVVRS